VCRQARLLNHNRHRQVSVRRIADMPVGPILLVTWGRLVLLALAKKIAATDFGIKQFLTKLA
jgi:hypothetical protein